MNSSVVQVNIVISVVLCGLIGFSIGSYWGAVLAVILGLVLCVIPWWGKPLWRWAALFVRLFFAAQSFRDSSAAGCSAAVTIVNDRSSGGVRYHDGVATVAVHVLGKHYAPTVFTGSTSTHTTNILNVSDLLDVMHQSLGLNIESLSVVSVGARRRSNGDYPRVYDTFIGTTPYAGSRQMWLIIRVRALENASALQWRTSVGTAALAAAQRVAAFLRYRGIRAKVATATELVEYERKLGFQSRIPHRQRWRTTGCDAGWLTTYAYRPQDITTDILAQAWSLRVDGIIQNITVFPDGTVTATVTVRSPQPPVVAPSVVLQPLPGEQSQAIAACHCRPRPGLFGVQRAVLPSSLMMPIGPSGVLLGKLGAGNRLLLPVSDPGEMTRILIVAGDAIAKRLIVRIAAAGERITVHTQDHQRWASVRMSHIVISDNPRPVSASAVSVVDGTVIPSPRPHTIISVQDPASLRPDIRPGVADIIISQTGLATVDVMIKDQVFHVGIELFRAENRYICDESSVLVSEERELMDSFYGR